MKNALMNQIYNHYSPIFLVLFCISTSLESSCAKISLGAHLNYKGKYTTDIEDYEVVVPQRVNKDGNFISHVLSHQHSKRSTKETDYVFYKIPIAGIEYLIELIPNRKLISPGAVVETHKINSSQNMTKNSGNLFKNISMRKLKNIDCHFSGHIRGDNVSKAALSTCYGLAGFIQIEKGFYTIEPVAEHDPSLEDVFPHIIYKSNDLDNNSFCSTTEELTSTLTHGVIRKRRESNIGSSTPMYIETLIVMDKSLIGYHKESDCENYVLTVCNMAFNLFHDASLGLMINPTIVRIIRLEVENDEMNLKVNTDAVKTLEYFQTWQYDINPGDDSHPNHHDVAVLLTRVDVCYSPSSCGLLGLSTIGKACDPKSSVALCEDNGLRLGFVIAHELGHLLGADHDDSVRLTSGFDGPKTIMDPQITLNSQTWSKSSQVHIKEFFKSGLGNCFLDEPEDHDFNVQDLLPGVMYDADFQCKHLITSDARECDRGSSCDSLNCYVPGYACILTHTPPADGTRCGERMWCHGEKCIVVGQRPGAVDGNWGEWSSWSDCTRTCGSGVSSSVRLCDKPLPSHGGKNCVGERKRYKVCATTPCKTGLPSFRDVQCGEFDDWVYPEDGKTHTWRAFYQHEDNPCMLYCINEEKTVAALRPRVVDGTMCYRGIRDICVGGACKTLPCDLHFESNAVEDVCGICHGDGTGCEFSGGTEHFTKTSKGLTKLIDVPLGTRNIKVQEMSATMAKIIVKDKESKEVYVKGTNLGMYSVPGSQAWLGMVKKNQEALSIPGPITKPLSILIHKTDNTSMKWSIALPPTQQRKPEFAWDFMTWGPCSAKCGPGTQKSEPSCMEEKGGLVESTFCVDLEMPPAKVRPCEVMKCEPRWMVGDWKGCEKPLTSGKIRKRVVYCIKPVGEGEGESEIVSDEECSEPKPHDTEPCENRQKREDSEEYGLNLFDDSTFISDTVEFGFHKKYDDYLTHFAALSGPQRKSETVPLHLLSSPHFKHYFRVLETPDDLAIENNYNGDFNFSGYESPHHQAQNKVSPDFYKNTFSGNPIDVSHVQSQYISVKARKNAPPPEICSRIFGNSQNRKKSKKMRSWEMLSRKRYLKSKVDKRKRAALRRIFENRGKCLRDREKIGMDRLMRRQNTEEKKPKNWQKWQPFTFSKQIFQYIPSRFQKSERKTKKRRNFESQSSRFRHSLRKLLFKKQYKNFNYTSPNLTDIVNNLNINDDNIKRRYMNLLRGMGSGKLVSEKSINDDSGPWYAITTENSIMESLAGDGRASDFPKDSSRWKVFLSIDKFRHEYDGSGIKKRVFDEINGDTFKKKNSLEEINKLRGAKKSWQERKNYFSEPYSSSASSRVSIHSPRPKFKTSYRTLEDLYLEKNPEKCCRKIVQKRNTNFVPRNRGLNNFSDFDCKIQPGIFINQRKIKKRLTRKWKKQKVKDVSGKGDRDSNANGYGTETRNYLNNLFRDTRYKTTPKPQVDEETEKTIINTGQLIIDRDLVDAQQVEIVLQEDNDEDSTKNYKSLPRPPPKHKLTLQGQQVFDLYQKLQNSRGNEKGRAEDVNVDGRWQTPASSNTRTDKPEDAINENEMEEMPDIDLLIENNEDKETSTEDYSEVKEVTTVDVENSSSIDTELNQTPKPVKDPST